MSHDQKIVAALRSGDEGALVQFLETNKRPLLAFIRSRIGTQLQKKVEPDDILQDASMEAVRDMALTLARVANPACQVVGISVNTQHMSEDEARAYLEKVEAEMGLPAVDPYRHGAERLAEALENL